MWGHIVSLPWLCRSSTSFRVDSWEKSEQGRTWEINSTHALTTYTSCHVLNQYHYWSLACKTTYREKWLCGTSDEYHANKGERKTWAYRKRLAPISPFVRHVRMHRTDIIDGSTHGNTSYIYISATHCRSMSRGWSYERKRTHVAIFAS